MGVEGVIARRRERREARLETASDYVRATSTALPALRAAVVIGSVARGDFNWSDIDLLLVAHDLPADYLARQELLPERLGGLEPIVWTPDEWRVQHGRGNPMAVDAEERGVWLLGGPEGLRS